jgi:GTP cyclohydrolase I
LIDIQSERDDRDVPLQKVGIKGLKYPVHVLDRDHRIQHTTATVNLYANLPRHFKGTHMSRFIEVFHQHRERLSMPHFLDMLEEIRTSLDAARAFGELSFPYFLEKPAPVSGQAAMMSYECSYEGMVAGPARESGIDGSAAANGSPGREPGTAPGNGAPTRSFFVSVAVPVQTVCPCSKAISAYGAHNQRGVVRVKLELGPFFWIEDLVSLIEECASSAVYSLLKREDEKYVTEAAYDNPKFVEDLVRDVILAIPRLGDFPWYSVEAENFESIHNHSAFAYAEHGVPRHAASGGAKAE